MHRADLTTMPARAQTPVSTPFVGFAVGVRPGDGIHISPEPGMAPQLAPAHSVRSGGGAARIARASGDGSRDVELHERVRKDVEAGVGPEAVQDVVSWVSTHRHHLSNDGVKQAFLVLDDAYGVYLQLVAPQERRVALSDADFRKTLDELLGTLWARPQDGPRWLSGLARAQFRCLQFDPEKMQDEFAQALRQDFGVAEMLLGNLFGNDSFAVFPAHNAVALLTAVQDTMAALEVRHPRPEVAAGRRLSLVPWLNRVREYVDLSVRADAMASVSDAVALLEDLRASDICDRLKGVLLVSIALYLETRPPEQAGELAPMIQIVWEALSDVRPAARGEARRMEVVLPPIRPAAAECLLRAFLPPFELITRTTELLRSTDVDIVTTVHRAGLLAHLCGRAERLSNEELWRSLFALMPVWDALPDTLRPALPFDPDVPMLRAYVRRRVEMNTPGEAQRVLEDLIASYLPDRLKGILVGKIGESVAVFPDGQRRASSAALAWAREQLPEPHRPDFSYFQVMERVPSISSVSSAVTVLVDILDAGFPAAVSAAVVAEIGLRIAALPPNESQLVAPVLQLVWQATEDHYRPDPMSFGLRTVNTATLVYQLVALLHEAQRCGLEARERAFVTGHAASLIGSLPFPDLLAWIPWMQAAVDGVSAAHRDAISFVGEPGVLAGLLDRVNGPLLPGSMHALIQDVLAAGMHERFKAALIERTGRRVEHAEHFWRALMVPVLQAASDKLSPENRPDLASIGVRREDAASPQPAEASGSA